MKYATPHKSNICVEIIVSDEADLSSNYHHYAYFTGKQHPWFPSFVVWRECHEKCICHVRDKSDSWGIEITIVRCLS